MKGFDHLKAGRRNAPEDYLKSLARLEASGDLPEVLAQRLRGLICHFNPEHRVAPIERIRSKIERHHGGSPAGEKSLQMVDFLKEMAGIQGKEYLEDFRSMLCAAKGSLSLPVVWMLRAALDGQHGAAAQGIAQEIVGFRPEDVSDWWQGSHAFSTIREIGEVLADYLRPEILDIMKEDAEILCRGRVKALAHGLAKAQGENLSWAFEFLAKMAGLESWNHLSAVLEDDPEPEASGPKFIRVSPDMHGQSMSMGGAS